ncbi:MAG: hypothetical protein BYD32DRAFT_408148 [Podila humilis]|nr:MAG: hypothetical protein BYD32DRAFT_408148 [Podila humilis]
MCCSTTYSTHYSAKFSNFDITERAVFRTSLATYSTTQETLSSNMDACQRSRTTLGS